MLLALRSRKGPNPPVGGAFPIATPNELLQRQDVVLDSIRQLAGVPEAHWTTLYGALFHSFARFAQRLPASEAHHHAGPGGLLRHGLETACEALKLRRGHMLPPGAPVEIVAAEQDLWTYAVATAALLHDLGKPVCDQRVALFGPAGEPLGDWAPCLGPMPAEAAWYRVTLVRDRRYRTHGKLPLLLAHHVVPREGLRWLGSNAEVLAAWTAVLADDDEGAGPLAEIVREADRISVASDLTGAPARMPTARRRPLHQRLLTALRHLLDQGTLPLNHRGAAGWVAGNDLWLVSKRALDALRDHLEHEGQGGIPTRNERLMDELQQHGVIVANGERAIWRAEVTLGEWTQALTTLRFPIAVVWPQPDARPQAFDGSVVPLSPEAASPDADRPGDLQPNREEQPPDTGDHEPRPEEPEGAGADTTGADANGNPENGRPQDGDAGERFAAWLREGLESGRLPVNTTSARVHTAAEGLLLVSPGIFKDFDPENWGHVQKRFQRLGLHRKTAKNTNIFTYLVQGGRRQGRIKVYLVPEPERLAPNVSLPPPNPYLSLLT